MQREGEEEEGGELSSTVSDAAGDGRIRPY